MAGCLLIKMLIPDTQKHFIRHLEIKSCSQAATRVVLEENYFTARKNKVEIFLLYQGVPRLVYQLYLQKVGHRGVN